MNCLKARTINFLPEEILQKIIFLLPFKDLKNVTSVCRRWLIIGEQKLAQSSRLCINHKNVRMMKKLLTSQRMKTMKSVRFLSWFLPVKESEAVILEIYINVDIEELIIRGNDLLIQNFRKDTNLIELEISDNVLFDGEPNTNMLAVWGEKMRQLISMKNSGKH